MISQLELTSFVRALTRFQFGPSLALYFSFLSFYTLSTFPLTILGCLAWAFLPTGSYSSTYALAASFWSIVVVEAWRIKERSLATKWGMIGVEKHEKYRAQSSAASKERVWWRSDLRVWASVPVLLLCAAGLVGVLTGLFVFEAFVTALYDGVGKEYIVSPESSSKHIVLWLTDGLYLCTEPGAYPPVYAHRPSHPRLLPNHRRTADRLGGPPD